MSAGGVFDPFSAWSRMVSAGLDMQSTWACRAETMTASGDVGGVRTEMMRAATASPLTDDYAELSRMVPEKMAGKMVVAGRMPSAAEVIALAKQSVNFAIGAMAAGANMGKRALEPVHRTPTGNARRLKGAQAR